MKHLRYLSPRAFTLIEILVALAVVGVLATLVVSLGQRARTSANIAKDTSNLRNIGSALLAYVVDHGGAFPVAASLPADAYSKKTYWFDALNPYMGYEAYAPDVGFDFPEPTATGTVFPLPWQLSPGKQVEPLQRQSVGYGWNVSNFGHSKSKPTTGYASNVDEVTEPSRTIIIGNSKDDDFQPGEANVHEHRYIFDYDTEKRIAYPRRYNGGGNYLFVDGHVEWISAERMTTKEVRLMFKKERQGDR